MPIRAPLAALALASLLATPAFAQSTTPLTPIAPATWLAHDPAGNVVVAVSKEAVVIVGPQTAAAAPALRAAIRAITPLPVRYVVITASPAIDASRDAGWTRAGATVIAEEHAARRMGGVESGPLSGPTLGFSEVQQIHLLSEDVHVVRQKPGNTDADVSTHLEAANVMVLGNAYVADGYPTIDTRHGGGIDGLIETASRFMTWSEQLKIVPGRGPVSTPAGLVAYHDMLVAIRDRVKALHAEGRSLEAILAARPTAAFDAQWGNEPGAATALVTAIVQGLSAPKTR